MSALTWLIQHCELMTDSDGLAIKSSGSFSGHIPARMTQELRQHMSEIGADYRDKGTRVYWSWRVDDTGYSLSLGAYRSTANNVQFNFCPDQW